MRKGHEDAFADLDDEKERLLTATAHATLRLQAVVAVRLMRANMVSA